MFENISNNFSEQSLSFVEDLLGECDQKQKRQAREQQRTPAEQQADTARSQALRGKDTVPAASRSAAAKQGAKTRSKCKGTSEPPSGVK